MLLGPLCSDVLLGSMELERFCLSSHIVKAPARYKQERRLDVAGGTVPWVLDFFRPGPWVLHDIFGSSPALHFLALVWLIHPVCDDLFKKVRLG